MGEWYRITLQEMEKLTCIKGGTNKVAANLDRKGWEGSLLENILTYFYSVY